MPWWLPQFPLPPLRPRWVHILTTMAMHCLRNRFSMFLKARDPSTLVQRWIISLTRVISVIPPRRLLRRRVPWNQHVRRAIVNDLPTSPWPRAKQPANAKRYVSPIFLCTTPSLSLAHSWWRWSRRWRRRRREPVLSSRQCDDEQS